MVAAFAGVAITGSIGTLLGLLAGYFRGWTDTLIMRATEVVMSLPGVLAAIPSSPPSGRASETWCWC